MQLKKLTDNVYYLPAVDELVWPVLTYVRGERFALAVDAGYSKQQVESFYSELDAAGLKRPDFTALTHWHYDHCFGLHAIDGLAIACEDTNAILRALSLKSGTQELLDEICKVLGVEPGECTSDLKFSIEACRCIGACGLAPVFTVNDDVYGRVTPEEVKDILAKYE